VADTAEDRAEAVDVLRAIMAEVGERPRPIDKDDAEGWVEEAASVVRDVPQLGISGWLCAVAALTLWGPRTQADAEALALIVAESEGGEPTELVGVFRTVEARWEGLGALDEEQRLTALGWWGLPEALLRAWA
jgi:hypothetical protein